MEEPPGGPAYDAYRSRLAPFLQLTARVLDSAVASKYPDRSAAPGDSPPAPYCASMYVIMDRVTKHRAEAAAAAEEQAAAVHAAGAQAVAVHAAEPQAVHVAEAQAVAVHAVEVQAVPAVEVVAVHAAEIQAVHAAEAQPGADAEPAAARALEVLQTAGAQTAAMQTAEPAAAAAIQVQPAPGAGAGPGHARHTVAEAERVVQGRGTMPPPVPSSNAPPVPLTIYHALVPLGRQQQPSLSARARQPEVGSSRGQSATPLASTAELPEWCMQFLQIAAGGFYFLPVAAVCGVVVYWF